MQAVEITVYILVAIIAGGLIISAIVSINHRKQYREYVEVFKSDEMEFKIASENLGAELAKRWEDCRFGIDNKTYIIYISDNTTLTREGIVQQLLRVDECEQIDCRNQTNRFNFPKALKTPKIINIQCFNNSLIVQ